MTRPTASKEPTATCKVPCAYAPTRHECKPHNGVGKYINDSVGDWVAAVLLLEPVNKRLALSRTRGRRIKQNATNRVGRRDSVDNLGQDYSWLVVTADRVKHPLPPLSHSVTESNSNNVSSVTDNSRNVNSDCSSGWNNWTS